MHINIKTNKGLVRDTKSMAILLTDHGPQNEYEVRKKMIETAKTNEKEISILKEEMGEIKSRLDILINLLGKQQ